MGKVTGTIIMTGLRSRQTIILWSPNLGSNKAQTSCIRYDSPGAKVGATELSASSSVSVSDSGNTRLSVIPRE